MKTNTPVNTLQNDGTITASTKEDTTITNTQRETLMGALRTMHPIVSTAGNWKPLPAFDECTEEDLEFICGRARKLLVAKGEAERSEARNGAKDAILAVIATHRAALVEGRNAVLTLLAANPALAASVKAPTSVDVPLFALMAAFPEGSKESENILVLRDLGYTVSFGAGKGKEKVPGYVRISHDAAGDATVAPTATVAA
jgi:hypothetical protein